MQIKRVLIIIITLLLMISICGCVPQHERAAMIRDNIKDNDYKALNRNFKKLNEDSIKLYKKTMDEYIIEYLNNKNFEGALGLLSIFKDVEAMSEYSNYRINEVSSLKVAHEAYEVANTLYNEIENTTNKNEKALKMLRSYDKYQQIDEGVYSYFPGLENRIEELKDSTLSLSYSIIDSDKENTIDDIKYKLNIIESAAKVFKDEDLNELTSTYYSKLQDKISSYITDSFDDMTNEYTYYAKNTPKNIGRFTFYAYVDKSKDSKYYGLNLMAGIRIDEFLHFDKITIRADDDLFDLEFDYFKHKFIEYEYPYCYEWVDIYEYYETLLKIAKAKNVKVRFSGEDNKYLDYVISDNQKNRLKQIIEFYMFHGYRGEYEKYKPEDY